MSLFTFISLLSLTAAVHGLICTVGFISITPYNSATDVEVASMPCLNGRCASFKTTTATIIYEFEVDLTTMFCAPEWLLNGTVNGCTDFAPSSQASFCVCDTDNCNSGGTQPYPADTSDTPILCYEGLVYDAKVIGGHLIPCFGVCYSVSVSISLAKGQFDATLYTCMPKGFYKDDKCLALREVEVCSACLDPGERGAYPEPIVDLECIRGSFIYNIFELGANVNSFQVRVPCPNGMCGNVYTICDSHVDEPGYLGQIMVERFCAPHELVEDITGRRSGGCGFLNKSIIFDTFNAAACFCDSAVR